MRYLAIDPGQKRSGLALGDDVTGIVTPMKGVTAESEQRWLQQVAKVIQEHQPAALVVGLPLNMDGSEGPAATRSRALATKLNETTGLDVYLFDERLSSFAADHEMANTDLSRRQKQSRQDALAAAVILRDFLASRST